MSQIITPHSHAEGNPIPSSFDTIAFFTEHQLFFIGLCLLFFLLGYLLHHRYKFLNLPLGQFALFIFLFEVSLTSILLFEYITLDALEDNRAFSNHIQHHNQALLNNWSNINSTLSEYAKAYIASDNKQFQQDYLHIHAIQKGEQPLPFQYNANYWRLNKQLRKIKHPDGAKSSLKNRIDAHSFTADEYSLIQALFSTSKVQKDIEQKSFNLLKVNKKEQANHLLYSEKYTHILEINALYFSKLTHSLYAKNKAPNKLLNQKIEQELCFLVAIFLFFIIGNILLYTSFKKKIIQPISYITSSIKEFNDGIQQVTPNNFFTDEIAEMMMRFFIMQEKILSQKQSLKDFNAGLGEQIEAKTQHLNEQKQELEVLLHAFNKNVIFSRTDLNGIITQASEAFCKISGYTEEELLGKPHNIVRHPDSPAKTFKTLWQALKNEQDITLCLKNKHKNGSSYWVESLFQADYNRHNQLIGYSATRHDITAEKELEYLSNNLQLKIDQAKQELAIVHQQTQDSIKYASLIQGALVADNELFRNYFSDYFVIWHPKDVVGGDIYFFEELRHKDECLLMVIDCTGHGVPGAFVSMLIKAVERQIVAQIIANDEEVSPAKLLSIFNRSLKKLLKQESSLSLSNVGFDGSILYYNKKNNLIKFAGANSPLITIKDRKINKIKGSRHSIGYKKSDANFEFTDHLIPIESDMQFYLCTDGYIDQNGGEKGFGFGYKRLQALLQEYAPETMADQQEILLYELSNYQGEYERNDDITIVGFKI